MAVGRVARCQRAEASPLRAAGLGSGDVSVRGMRVQGGEWARTPWASCLLGWLACLRSDYTVRARGFKLYLLVQGMLSLCPQESSNKVFPRSPLLVTRWETFGGEVGDVSDVSR